MATPNVSSYERILPIDSHIDSDASDIFARLLRFYKTFNIISALISGLSIAMLTFNEFHPATSKQLNVAECLLVISVFTGVISIMVTNILLFGFEGYTSVTCNDMALAWSPLVILDFSILAFLGGLLLWSTDKSNYWTIPVLGSLASILLLINCWAAINTYFIMSRTGR